jgi:uncharacterized membrane protein YqhA
MSSLTVIKEFIEFLGASRKWWLIPIFVLLALLGVMFFFAEGSIIAPFIYTLF